MKKILAILLCAILICGAFAGCGNTVQDASSDISSVVDTSSDITSQDTTNKDTFTKPENYATVVKVTINPEFNLYLDENGFVLAVEPLNDDAKTISITITDKNKEVKTFVKELVNETKEKGFLKDDATVKVETKDKEAFTEKVVEAVESIEETFKTEATTLGVTVTVEVIDKTEDTSSEETSSEDVSSDGASSEDVSSNDTSSDATSSNPVSSTAPVEIKIEYGKEYYCIVETSETTIDYLSVKFNKDGTGEYIQSGYQDTNPNAGTEYEEMGSYIEYKSKKYYNCAGLGDDFTYIKDGDKIIITTYNKRVCELTIANTNEFIATKFPYYEGTPENAKFKKTDKPLEKPIKK